ncbi:MAG: hypothetical protein JWP00_542 [Chloroflexi bacterium]|jgi:hypothetical protein|nr:hypothetical protein [Chloroflexota bacterium]
MSRFFQRIILGLAILLVCNLILVPATAEAATPDQVASFRQLWARTDDLVYDGVVSRSWVWGPEPLNPSYKDRYRYSASGTYFERAFRHYDKGRMEIDARQPVNSKWYIRGGTLVKELVSGRTQTSEVGEQRTLNPINVATPAQIPVVGDAQVTSDTPTYATFTDYSFVNGVRSPSRVGQSVSKLINRNADTVLYDPGDPMAQITAYEEATGHNIPRAFTDYFARQGMVLDARRNKVTEPLFDPVHVFGYPITEPYWARVLVGGKSKMVMLQLFERRVLSYTPSNPAEWQVEMGNVGQHYLAWRSMNELTFTGAPRITLEQFRKVLVFYRSPVISEAGDLYATIVKSGLDPGVALAFFVRESGAGTAVGYCDGENSLNNKNWGNVRGEEDGACGFQRFPTWKAGLEAWCRLMIKYFVNKGLNRMEDAIPVYAPASDGNNPPQYIREMYSYILKWQGYSV